jgi:hypothetical protein
MTPSTMPKFLGLEIQFHAALAALLTASPTALVALLTASPTALAALLTPFTMSVPQSEMSVNPYSPRGSETLSGSPLPYA